jgi:replication factor C large subunit
VEAVNQNSIEWTEKYRPRTLAQVRGNDRALTEMRRWASVWEAGIPTKKGLILVGKPGTGKTSAAYALASELNWGVIELNASDARNAENIKKVAYAGSINETFTATGEFVSVKSGGRKIIILDEADNLFERVYRKEPQEKDMSDHGGKAAIIEMLRKTQQPVILIVNDLYELTRETGAPIKQLTEVVKFNKLRQPTVRLILKHICDSEGVKITSEALDELSRRADGDMRSAINDLQTIAESRNEIKFEHLKVIGERNVKSTIFDAIREIFKTTDPARARKAIWNLDESPEDIIHWLDENLPLEYRRAPDLARGFDILSKADIYLGKIRRRQYYRFWVYANDLMTSGIALAKQDRYHGWVNYQFPSWILHMSRTKQLRQLQKSVSRKVGQLCHTSQNVMAKDILPYFRQVFKADHEFAVKMSIDLDLSKEELGWLIEEKITSKKMKYLLSEIKQALDLGTYNKVSQKSPELFPYVDTPKEEATSGKSKKTRKRSKKEVKDDELNDNSTNDAPDESQEDTNAEIADEPDDDQKEGKKVQRNLFDF